MALCEGLRRLYRRKAQEWSLIGEEREYLFQLVLGVKYYGRSEEFLEYEPNDMIRFRNIKGLDGRKWIGVVINSEEYWEKAVRYAVQRYNVNKDWGTVKKGTKKFKDPGIYMFTVIVEESYREEDDSNYSGGKCKQNFLECRVWEEWKKVLTDFIKDIDGGWETELGFIY